MNWIPGIALGLLAGLLAGLIVGGLLFRPLAPRGLDSHASPARSYDEALRLLSALGQETPHAPTPALMPGCETKLLTHGSRTPRVVVLFHGLTHCPAQFDSLGRRIFERGVNVLIPRLPRHGLSDRMTEEPGRTDALELCGFSDHVLDIAQGLGDSVTIAGLSISGTMVAWLAQERAGVERAVAITPLVGVPQARGAFRRAATRLALALPNLSVWWDAKQRENLAGPKHVYPRFATRAVAASLLLGTAVQDAARHRAPACRSIAVVTVGGDHAVDNDEVARLVGAWRSWPAVSVTTYEFPADLELSHDVVDPEQVGGNPALTYPILLELIDP